jgi:hypothetical protein
MRFIKIAKIQGKRSERFGQCCGQLPVFPLEKPATGFGPKGAE